MLTQAFAPLFRNYKRCFLFFYLFSSTQWNIVWVMTCPDWRVQSFLLIRGKSTIRIKWITTFRKSYFSKLQCSISYVTCICSGALGSKLISAKKYAIEGTEKGITYPSNTTHLFSPILFIHSMFRLQELSSGLTIQINKENYFYSIKI